MKHLLVTNDYPPKVGGIQNYLWELYRRFPSAEFSVLTTPYEGDTAYDAAQNHEIERFSRFWLSPTPDVRRLINQRSREVAADLVVIDPALPLGALGPSLDLPYALIIHGTEAVVPARVPGMRSAYAATMSSAALLVSSSMWATGVSQESIGPADFPPSVYVPPGVDTDRFVPLSTLDRAAARRRFGVPEDASLVFSVSRLVPRKGMDRLIEATAQLGETRPELQTLIAGTGRDDKRLRSLISSTGAPARLLGRVEDADLPALYGCADVFAMLCRNRWGGLEQEGFGIVFVEAAACGVAQVAGDSGGAAEAVAHGATGLVVKAPSSVDAVADALATLLDDKAMRDRFGQHARERACAEFSYDVLVERYRNALDQTGLKLAETEAR